VVGLAGFAAGVVAGWAEDEDGLEDDGGASQRIGKVDPVEEPSRLSCGFWEPAGFAAGLGAAPADRPPAPPPPLAERRLPAGEPFLPPPIFPADACPFAPTVDCAGPPALSPFPCDNPEPVPTT